jgi:ParB-like chromosome segregation protein Spo0J
MTTKFHPLADMLPLVEGAEIDRLVADIIENGLLNPITRYQGQILDGRNRERACRAAGVEPRYVEFEGKDPAAFVFSQNLARRHLGPSERAMVAARMVNLKWGQRADRVEGSIDLSTAAKLVNVSEPSVKRAKVVLEHGIRELQEAVDRGRVAVHVAEKAARESTEAQAKFLAAVAAGRTFQSWQNNHARKKRAAELAGNNNGNACGQRTLACHLGGSTFGLRGLCAGQAEVAPRKPLPCNAARRDQGSAGGQARVQRLRVVLVDDSAAAAGGV